MTIIRPDQLLDQADMLIRYAGGQQVALRRAVSAAYYGLFHTASIAIADHTVGRSRRNSAEWSLACRHIDHGPLRTLCRELIGPNPSSFYRPFIPSGSSFSNELRAFAGAIVELQQKRHDADYNHSASFKVSDVENIVLTARTAHQQFQDITYDEKRVFVTLLLFKSRK